MHAAGACCSSGTLRALAPFSSVSSIVIAGCSRQLLLVPITTAAAARNRDPFAGDDAKLQSKTLYVGNMPYHFFEDEVRRLFDRFGPIVQVTVRRDNFTGQNKGCAARAPALRLPRLRCASARARHAPTPTRALRCGQICVCGVPESCGCGCGNAPVRETGAGIAQPRCRSC